MKISNSKKELARIIRENGGWRGERKHAVQDKDDRSVWFIDEIEGRDQGRDYWNGSKSGRIKCSKVIPNWHQTILSRAEYFHLYPAQDADGWIKRDENGIISIEYNKDKPEQAKPEFCESVMRSIPEPSDNPTIEQLVADYRQAVMLAEIKQHDADAAKADADARLKALELAGEALGLLVSPITAKQEAELVIEFKVGDEVECVESNIKRDKYNGMVGSLRLIDESDTSTPYLVDFGGNAKIWCHEVKFIRRP